MYNRVGDGRASFMFLLADSQDLSIILINIYRWYFLFFPQMPRRRGLVMEETEKTMKKREKSEEDKF